MNETNSQSGARMGQNWTPRIILILLTLTLVFQLFIFHSEAREDDDNSVTETLTPITGYCSNPDVNSGNAVKDNPVALPNGPVTEIIFELTWTDEPDSQPDTFELSVSDGENEPTSDSSPSGTITLTLTGESLNKDWTATVECKIAGDTDRGPLGLLTETDKGNNWRLEITYTYSAGAGPGGPPGGMPPHMVELYNSTIFWVHVGMMIASTYMFLVVGILAGLFLFFRTEWFSQKVPKFKLFVSTRPFIIPAVVVFILFFLASVPVGMYVAGKAYGWHLMWSGFPTLWNEGSLSMKNADNVSLIVLVLWFIPFYLNRRDYMNHRAFKKLFGWSGFLMRKARSAPKPILQTRELALIYCLLGIMVYVVFMVQPHG